LLGTDDLVRYGAWHGRAGFDGNAFMTTNSNTAYSLDELNKERTLGGIGATKAREVPRIDLSDFEARKAAIAEQLWQAATEIGFFQLVNHGIPQQQIDEAFTMTERFFALPHEVKAQYPLGKGSNAGWEYKSQVRPSTGTPDQKESYQITLPRMAKLWPSGDRLPGFKATMLAFERANWALGMNVLSCFALKLGFAPDFFTDGHDPLSSEYQCTLRLLHYLPMIDAKPEDFSGWRAGAHTDFDCLTLLHQRAGQGGLQLCPGKKAAALAWTDVEPLPGVVTCNIGDMLMRWSDDKLQSTLHRVRMPRADEYLGPRLFAAVLLPGQQRCGDPRATREIPADHRARLSAAADRGELRRLRTARVDHVGDFQDAVPVAPGRRRTAGLVDQQRRKLRPGDAVRAVVDPQRAGRHGNALAGLRLRRQRRSGARIARLAREIKIQHLRHGRGIVGKRIGCQVSMPLCGRAHDDVDAQAEALGDGTFEQRADFVGRQVGVDNEVAALDIGLRTLQADFDGERPQLGHRQLARRADIDAPHQRHQGFHRLSLSEIPP
jgi:isopenicillin N synthase-like dioxygenase